jgi:hypothetical protein
MVHPPLPGAQWAHHVPGGLVSASTRMSLQQSEQSPQLRPGTIEIVSLPSAIGCLFLQENVPNHSSIGTGNWFVHRAQDTSLRKLIEFEPELLVNPDLTLSVQSI